MRNPRFPLDKQVQAQVRALIQSVGLAPAALLLGVDVSTCESAAAGNALNQRTRDRIQHENSWIVPPNPTNEAA